MGKLHKTQAALQKHFPIRMPFLKKAEARILFARKNGPPIKKNLGLEIAKILDFAL
jgi:hypothetical protein